MSFEEEFDKIIRHKSEELDYPFDEKNWEKASAMLDNEKKAAGIRGFRHYILPALLGTLVVVSGTVLVLNNPTSAEKPSSGKSLTENNNTNNIIKSEEKAIAEKQNSLVTANHEISSITKTPETSVVNTNANNQAIDHNTTRNATPSAKSIPVIPTGEPVADAEKTSERPIVTTATSDKHVFDQGPENLNAQTGTGMQNNNSGDTNKENNTANTGNNTTGVKVTGSDNAAMQNNSGKDNVASVSSDNQAIIRSEEDQSRFEMLPLLAVSNPLQEEKEIVAAPLNYMKRYDDDYFKNGNKKTHFMNVELGGTYMLGWHTAAGMDGKGLDWFAGVNYGLYITKKLNISLGLQAYNIKNITQAFYTRKTVEYTFGSVTSNTVITSNNLYYAALPLKISYTLNKTSQLGFGANFGYLVNSKNTVETYEVQDNIRTHYTPVKNTGVYQNANSLNLMLGVSYNVEVMPRLCLNTEFVYGLSDIFKNTKTNNNKEQAMGIRLSLKYTLFDK